MHALGARGRRPFTVGVVIAGLLLGAALPLNVSARPHQSSDLTPIVLFPAGTSRGSRSP
jgi:hypothetical protein